MTHFFKVKTLEQVMALVPEFAATGTESIHLYEAVSRVLAVDIYADHDLPGFRRSTMDGYAVHSASTFGASESNPAWLTVTGSIAMGETPRFSIQQGEAAKISTGGMLPEGADSVVMLEHTDPVDDATVEVYKSVAPLQNVIEKNEDFSKGRQVLRAGTLIRPQEAGLAAALGINDLTVHRIPRVGIISTGDEIVPADETPPLGKIRNINSHTLTGLVMEAGAMPIQYGIVRDNEKELFELCAQVVKATDMVLISGGSSVGVRDFTVDVLSSLESSELLVHGISISPGKPTILARSGIAGAGRAGAEAASKSVWGLPGHVVSAMVVFQVVVLPFLRRLKGLTNYAGSGIQIPARLTRNVSSAQGRTDFIRVRLIREGDENGDENTAAIQCSERSEREGASSSVDIAGGFLAVPVLGKSGLIRTMVMADGLLEIGENVEGMEKGDQVMIIPMI